MDDKLSWRHHINILRSKLSSSNFALNNTKSLLSFRARLNIFHSLINSHINYCSIIYSNTKCKEFSSLNTLHKKAIRNVTLSKYNEHTNPLYKKLKLTNLTDTILLQKVLVIHNFRHDRLPISFTNILTYKTDTNSIGLEVMMPHLT